MNNNILILDDDLPVQQSLMIYLSDVGFQTYGCATAEEALDIMEQHDIALVVVDLRLPGMDGLSFIEVANQGWPEVKYIIYTGSPELKIPAAITAMHQVSRTVFFKPVRDMDEIATEIRTHLGLPDGP